MAQTGTLYFVATPIGNLGDITLRALETLRQVDCVVSEDTRRTGLLLKHFEIQKPQISCFEHNERAVAPRIIHLLEEGKSVATVTSAGTPGVSDPGFVLLRLAIEAGIEVTAIPGPTAFVTALVLSGLPVHSFTFRGFPPHKGGQRRRFLEADKDSPYTLIYYESPFRVRRLLEDALAVFGDRPAVVAKELTKIYESVRRGRLSELLAGLEENPKGEFVVLIAGQGYNKSEDAEENDGATSNDSTIP
jgi:16S rRNA (cytidine1402-2'-O)-methyltransferase